MNIKELKTKIQDKSLGDGLLILKWKDNDFIPLEYIKAIAKAKNKEIVYIDSLDEVATSDFDVFNSNDNFLFVLIQETLVPANVNLSSLKNTIAISKKVDDIFKDYIVEISELQEWQVIDYMKVKCQGLDEAEIKWLYDIASGNIDRISNEMDKLSIFPKEEQESIFNLMNMDNGYVDLNPLNIFNLSNAIIKKKYKEIGDVIKDIDNLDIEATGLVTILKRNIKNIIDIQMNPKATPQLLGMKPNQFKAIEYNCNIYTNTQLIKIYEFLTSIDSKLKNGELQMDNNTLVSYMICNILNRGRA